MKFVFMGTVLRDTIFFENWIIRTVPVTCQQYRNKKKAEIQQLNNDYGRALLEYNKLSAELERMKQQDGSLMLDKQQEVEELKARLHTYQAALQTNSTSQQLSVFQESSIMKTFRKKSKVSPQTSLPTETEWKRLVSQFSRALPYAYAALGRDVILSTNELRVCILLLSGFRHQPQGKGQQQAFRRKFRLNARTKPDEHRRFGIAEYT